MVVGDEYDGEIGSVEFGEELGDGEGKDGLRIGDLLGDFTIGIEGISGGNDGTEGHDREANYGEEDGIG